jgi:peptidoglycan/xylan/chitin deacetylase (PgdA/CDA1 family)
MPRSWQRLRSHLLWLPWRLKLTAVARSLLTSNARFALMFHGVPRRRYPELPAYAQPALVADDLRAILSWIAPRFAFLTPEEFLHTRKRGVLLTFDDGLANNYTTVLPLLAEFGAPAAFFVIAAHLGAPTPEPPAPISRRGERALHAGLDPDLAADMFGFMSREQALACAQHPLITIGSHTLSHPRLSRCDSTRLMQELVDSRRFLRDLLGQSVDLLAYPKGDYSEAVALAARAAGYRAAFAIDGRQAGPAAFTIPRVGIAFAERPYLSAKLSGLHGRAIRAPLNA